MGLLAEYDFFNVIYWPFGNSLLSYKFLKMLTHFITIWGKGHIYYHCGTYQTIIVLF